MAKSKFLVEVSTHKNTKYIFNAMDIKIAFKTWYGDIAKYTVRPYKDKVCKWEVMDKWEQSGDYNTSCGESFSCTDGDRKENSMRYCPYCGGKIKEDK